MKQRPWTCRAIAAALFLGAFALFPGGTKATDAATGIPLVAEGKPVAAIVMSGKGSTLQTLARDALQEECQALVGVRLPEASWEKAAGLDAAIVIGEADSLPQELRERIDPSRIREDGFVIETARMDGKPPVLAICGRTARGAYNGAIYLRDLYFRPASDKDFILPDIHLLRNPVVSMRIAHTAEEWNDAAWLPLEKWEWVIDQIAQWGWTTWAPCPDSPYDAREHAELKTYPDATLDRKAYNALIDSAHTRGVKVVPYATAFFWLGADKVLNREYKGQPSIRAEGRRGGMCPSDPKARALAKEYVLEYLKAFPKSDGIGLDPGDEEGECQCERCRVSLDEFGSHQYGVSLISFYKEVAENIWAKRPEMSLGITIGFENFRFPGQVPAHLGDVKYYQALKAWNDPRVWFLQNYKSWVVVGADGKPSMPLEELTRKAGFTLWSEGSAHHRKLWQEVSSRKISGAMDFTEPHKWRDSLPWYYWNFEARESSWESSTGGDCDAQWNRYLFGPEAGEDVTKPLSELLQLAVHAKTPKTQVELLFSRPYVDRELPRQLIEEVSRSDLLDPEEASRWEAYLTRIGRFGRNQVFPRLEAVEAALAKLEPDATPRTRLNVRRHIRPWLDRIRREYCLTPEGGRALDAALKRLAEHKGRSSEFPVSRRGGIRRWEVSSPADGIDPGADKIQSAPAESWLACWPTAYPDQVPLKKLGTSPNVSGYARTCIQTKTGGEAILSLGAWHGHFGNRTALEIRLNGKKVGGYDEIQGGFVSQGERGFPMAVTDPNEDPLAAYMALASYPIRLEPGENEIVVRMAREEILLGGRKDSPLPLCFDVRVLGRDGKPLDGIEVVPKH